MFPDDSENIVFANAMAKRCFPVHIDNPDGGIAQ